MNGTPFAGRAGAGSVNTDLKFADKTFDVTQFLDIVTERHYQPNSCEATLALHWAGPVEASTTATRLANK